MEVILHRRNTIVDLENADCNFGVEIDIRSYGNNLVLQHEPFTDGILFEVWLENFNHGTLIINVKEEGLEPRLLAILSKYKIENYFILDESFPYIIKWSRRGLKKFALRLSDLEHSLTAGSLIERELMVEWVWLDCFDLKCPDPKLIKYLKQAGVKTCIVSPELHILDQPARWERVIDSFLLEFGKFDESPTAVCTKLPNKWNSHARR